ncbi:hypothetical protein JR316_0012235 [Psilocybe cubensis]|uniref:Uncharacterized protein n=2 Tax=Psilocybe cubensis TaxID=181762 RepID=A0ACB8GI00_PSICU|nr:hypothetical protein JR316_0012235 [Psilocybe cubensis]KAH9475124.1 hypothetical protein JR316_0012235 [Psilocybe cubensis]
MSFHTAEPRTSFLGDEEEVRAWDLKDEFRHAPKKPEVDPWKILLDPLLEREKKRCDSWNTEIQNLLIFAGLFSGLVTAFIIESYKTLQPDPNDDIVAILSSISQHISNSSNHSSAATLPSSTFIPPRAAVRVNVFWFISLILSLTVILSGIITMQWLREHQAYTGQSSKDMIAILNMRVESLEKWHVKNIITTFPLVLALALVLFFAGIIDFLHVLGNHTVLVAVAVVITITLILLVASTTLPSAQCTFLYLWLGHQDPPSPCPYKSPQSGFFHSVCYYISSFFSRHRIQFFIALGKWFRGLTALNARNKHALLYLTDTWSKKTWSEVDLCWLSIREACLFPPELDGYHDFLDRNGISPLFDITKTFKGIIEGVKLSSEMLFAVYHCFYEISAPFVSRDHPKRKAPTKTNEIDQTFEMIRWRNDYFHSLIHGPDDANILKITFLPVKGDPNARKRFHANINILHHHSLFAFVDRLKGQYPTEFTDHRVEISIRLADNLYSRWYETSHAEQHPLPPYLKGHTFDQRRWKTFKHNITVPVFQQYVYLLSAFFKGVTHSKHTISSNDLLAHEDVIGFLENAAWDTFRVVAAQSLRTLPPSERRKALTAFKSLLTKMTSFLMCLTQPTPEIVPANPIHLLVFCAIYVRRLNSWRFQSQVPMMDQQATGFLEEAIINIRDCKQAIIDKHGFSYPETLKWFVKQDQFGSVDMFSDQWWRFLYGKYDEYCQDSEKSVRKEQKSPSTLPMTSAASRPTVPMGGFRIPVPPSFPAATSMSSVYSDESYASSGEDSPITSTYSSLFSTPSLLPRGDYLHPYPPKSSSSLRGGSSNRLRITPPVSIQRIAAMELPQQASNSTPQPSDQIPEPDRSPSDFPYTAQT